MPAMQLIENAHIDSSPTANISLLNFITLFFIGIAPFFVLQVLDVSL